MKKQFFKIAGVKNDKEFYKKFPTEESFMAKHGKEIKKLQYGADVNSNSIPDYLEPNLNDQPAQNFNFSGNDLGQGNFSGNVFQAGQNMMNPPKQNQNNLGNQWAQRNPLPDGMSEGIPQDIGYNPQANSSGFSKSMKGINKQLGGLFEGLEALDAEKEQKRYAQQSRKVSELTLMASATRPEQLERRYVRPEDNVNSGQSFFPTYGVGTNVLAKEGAQIPQVTPDYKMYENLGYMSLNQPQNFRKAQYGQMISGIASAFGGSGGGGGMMSAIGGGSEASGGSGQGMGQMIGNMSGGGGGAPASNAGGQVGGTVGGAIGSIWGPLGQMVGQKAGTIIGDVVDTNPKKIKKAREATHKNIMNTALNQSANGIQSQYYSYMKEGGNIPSSMEQQGDLQTHWGGHAEQLSSNPHLPNGGETVMFRGQSHDDGGIGITYGGNPVEVERGEPAMESPEGDALTVFGDLEISPEYAEILGDKRAKNRKFKNYVAELSKFENKQNKIVEKNTNTINDLPLNTSFDKLKMSSAEANVVGANMKLKDIAEKKLKASNLQNAINETASELGLVAKDLAKGKFRKDKSSSKMKTAQDGYQIIGKNPGSIDYNDPNVAGGIWAGENYQSQWLPKVNDAFSNQERADEILSRIQNYSGQDYQDVRGAIGKYKTKDEQMREAYRLATDKKVGPYHKLMDGLINETVPSLDASILERPEMSPVEIPIGNKQDGYIDNQYEVSPYKRNHFADAFNMILPMLRPTNQEPLDANQLMGEMFAMSNNQLEPVQAQTYQPDLGIPYDISLQDQLNANQADFRSGQRMMGGYNPGAQSVLNAQKYNANSQVLGEQFRLNQAMKDGVYRENRNTLNDAKLKNLDIFDRQYVRQSQAKSNTKAVSQAAINSISDKYAKHNLDNRKLGIYENMYNYRYDAAGRAINMNPLWQPNMPFVYGPNGEITHRIVKDDKGKIIGYEPIGEKETPSLATPPYVPIEEKRMGGNIRKNYGDKSLVKLFK